MHCLFKFNHDYFMILNLLLSSLLKLSNFFEIDFFRE